MNSPVYPYSQLIYPSSSAFIAVSGPHVQTIDPLFVVRFLYDYDHSVDSRSGKVLSSSTNFPPEEQKTLLSSGPIRCAVLDNEKIHLATVGDDKTLRVWSVGNGDLKVASERLVILSPPSVCHSFSLLVLIYSHIARELPKKPTSVAFTADGQTILVSDKFGDIFRCVINICY